MSAIFWIVDASAMIQAALGGACHCLARCSWPQRGSIPFGAPPSTTRTQLCNCATTTFTSSPPLSHTTSHDHHWPHNADFRVTRVSINYTEAPPFVARRAPKHSRTHVCTKRLAGRDPLSCWNSFVERRGVSVPRAKCCAVVVAPCSRSCAQLTIHLRAWSQAHTRGFLTALRCILNTARTHAQQ